MAVLNPFRGLSLRVRIFLSMASLIVLASIMMVTISIYQFNNESKQYHHERLQRKEKAVKEHINYILYTTTYPLSKENIPLIFKDRIFELANIHSLEISIYGLDGQLLKTSLSPFSENKKTQVISEDILKKLEIAPDKRYVELITYNNEEYRSLYAYVNDSKFKPLFIVYLPRIESNSYYIQELQKFLVRLAQVNISMIVIAIALAYFLSRYITSSLNKISEKLSATEINQQNEKIVIKGAGKEIRVLVNSYNKMIDKLEESAHQLAQNEREQAWREMAKQVAHEIKNPLTPMQLTVQNFQRKYNPADSNNIQKVNDFCESMIQQIDTMNTVASAFSNFASMPAQQNETVDLVKMIPLALEIFNKDYIFFNCSEKQIQVHIDRTQLIRIINNLVKNAIQAIPEDQENKKIEIQLFTKENLIYIQVTDNGKGIEPEFAERIFEPKFTTKSSGMGLGLGIIKNIIENYNGHISFTSVPHQGTTFTLTLPKPENHES